MRLIFLLLVLISILSCSNDNESADAFFNINVGNEWVYKSYQYPYGSPEAAAYTGQIDSLKIVAEEMINGITFSKLERRTFNTNVAGSLPEITHTYLRVNNNGYLISYGDHGMPLPNDPAEFTEQGGLILHPGDDANFFINRTHDWGVSYFESCSAESIEIEDQFYNVIPMIGTSSPYDPNVASKTVRYDYAPEIGLVRWQYVLVTSDPVTEERLVSYNLQ